MNYKTLISSSEIENRVKSLGSEINIYYKNKNQSNNPVVVMPVLNGSIIFTADLIRHFDFNTILTPVTMSSYSNNKQSALYMKQPPDVFSISDKHLLIVEDIVDTGETIKMLKKWLSEHSNVKSITICSLLLRNNDNNVDFFGFGLNQDDFVFGYGLDYSNEYRNLPYIAIKT